MFSLCSSVPHFLLSPGHTFLLLPHPGKWLQVAVGLVWEKTWHSPCPAWLSLNPNFCPKHSEMWHFSQEGGAPNEPWRKICICVFGGLDLDTREAVLLTWLQQRNRALPTEGTSNGELSFPNFKLKGRNMFLTFPGLSSQLSICRLSDSLVFLMEINRNNMSAPVGGSAVSLCCHLLVLRVFGQCSLQIVTVFR